MAVESFTDKARRKRREDQRNWTSDDERYWLEKHPEDEPLPSYEAEASEPEPTFDADLVPEVDEYERPEEEIELDHFIDRIGIVEAYNKWANKGHVDAKGKTEGIKVRCPNPAHPDHDPSAWLNTNKDVWVCGGCGMEGGDKFDIAAWGLNFNVPGYKSGKQFPELRRAMAMNMGHTVRSGGSGSDRVVVPSESKGAPAASTSDTTASDDVSPAHNDGSSAEPSNVTALHPEPEPAEPPMTQAELAAIKIDWPKLTENSHFLRTWMNEASKDDLSEEFYFWCGLLALGFSAGNDVYLQDHQDVYANLFLTVIGTTGSGKSRSINNAKRLIKKALPYEHDDPANTGTRMVTGLASGEALVDQFYKLEDPLDPMNKNTIPVRGLIDFSELSYLVGKAASANSTIKPKLMDFYDHVNIIDASSRTTGDVRAIDAFGSCITTTQPRNVRTLVTRSDMDSGFMNRWMFIYGDPKDRIAYGNKALDLSEPIEALKNLKSWCASKRNEPGMQLKNEALDMWVKFHAKTILPIIDPKNYNDALEENPMLGRIELLFKKLILLFAIDAKENTPSVESVQKALSLWPYIEVVYTRVSGNIAATEEGDIENDIVKYIKSYESDGRKAQRKHISSALNKNYRLEDIKRAIERLFYLEILEEEEKREGTRGPAKKYIVLKE